MATIDFATKQKNKIVAHVWYMTHGGHVPETVPF